jgi:hypothetical protein
MRHLEKLHRIVGPDDTVVGKIRIIRDCARGVDPAAGAAFIAVILALYTRCPRFSRENPELCSFYRAGTTVAGPDNGHSG